MPAQPIGQLLMQHGGAGVFACDVSADLWGKGGSVPVFDFSSQLPGLSITNSFTVAGTGDTAQIAVRLSDPILAQDTTDSLNLAATYNPATSVVTLAGNFNPAVSLAGGNLNLNSLTLTVQSKDRGTGAFGLDTTGNAPIAATGRIDWVGAAPAAIQAPGSKIGFNLSYLFDPASGTSGFQLQLPNPLTLQRVAVTISAASFGVDVIPAESAFVLALEGQAALDASVTGKITSTLEKLFGTGKSPNLTSPKFRFRHKYRLAAPGIPSVALDLPSLTLLPDWAAPSALPPLQNPPNGVSLSLGLPRFTFTLPTDLTALPDFDLHLLNSSLHFPDLASLKAFRITGSLDFTDTGSGGFSLGFSPSLPGGMDLPEALKFFLSRFTWAAGTLPDIGQLGSIGSISQVDLDWFRLFQGLLPAAGSPIDLNGFKVAFQGILNAALQLPNPPSLDHLFDLAFQALETGSGDIFGAVWEVWLGMPNAAANLAQLLLNLSASLSAPNFELVLEKLFGTPGLDLAGLLSDLLHLGDGFMDTDIESFLRFWVGFLAAALKGFDIDGLGRALHGLLINPPSTLTTSRSLGDFDFFKDLHISALPAFELPTGSLLIACGLQSLVVIADLPTVLPTLPSPGTFLQNIFLSLLNNLKSIFGLAPFPDFDPSLLLRLFHALMTNAQGDPEAELMLLRLGRIFPLGIIFALVGAVKNLLTSPAPWLGLLFHSIEEDAAIKVKRFPPPAPASGSHPAVKYLIISDLHRDSQDDKEGPFDFGSIHHFLSNQQLYSDILDYADAKGYTLLEGGDCEELWFIRDFTTYLGPKDKVNKVMSTHQVIYDRLLKLHRKGRYFRIFGNHDSELRDTPTRQPLVDFFQAADPVTGQSTAFTIYDHLIIDGVKTMDDFSFLSSTFQLAGDLWNTTTGQERVDQLISNTIAGHLGLDSTPYTTRKPLIVTHGHEFDFWNCDQNNLVGKLIANSVGVPVDDLNDPFANLGGIAVAGSPLLDLANGIATLPVFSNFPSYEPAARFAHKIQHQDNTDRVLINDVFYLEWIPSLMSTFGMPLTYTDPQGTVFPWSKVFSDSNHLKHFFDHFMNGICVGHTHYPQSQPYYPITDMLLVPPINQLVQFIRDQLAKLMFGFKIPINFLKSRYFNSGTAGWMEGIVWAIEVDESGQARLIFWTRDTKIDCPQKMDWELTQWDPALRAALQARLAEVEKQFQELVEQLLGAVAAAAALPLDIAMIFGDLLSASPGALQLNEVSFTGLSAAEGTAQVGAELGKLAQTILRIFMGLIYRQFPAHQAAAQTFTISVPIPSDVESRLTQLQGLLGGLPNVPQSALTHVAAVWLAASQGLPFVNGLFRGAIPTHFPVLASFLALLPLLPPTGASSLFDTTLTMSNGNLNLVIALP